MANNGLWVSIVMGVSQNGWQWKYNGNIMGIWFVIIAITMLYL